MVHTNNIINLKNKEKGNVVTSIEYMKNMPLPPVSDCQPVITYVFGTGRMGGQAFSKKCKDLKTNVFRILVWRFVGEMSGGGRGGSWGWG